MTDPGSPVRTERVGTERVITERVGTERVGTKRVGQPRAGLERPGRGRGEAGSASVLMIGVMTVVMFLSLAAMVVAGYLVSVHRARGAADLAALSGAAAYEQGDDACPVARQTARHNGGAVVECSQVGDVVDFVVSVQVRMDVDTRIPGLPRSVTASAHAGPVA